MTGKTAGRPKVFTKETISGFPVCSGFRLPISASKGELTEVRELVEDACELWTWWTDKLQTSGSTFGVEFQVVYCEMQDWWVLLNDLNKVIRRM